MLKRDQTHLPVCGDIAQYAINDFSLVPAGFQVEQMMSDDVRAVLDLFRLPFNQGLILLGVDMLFLLPLLASRILPSLDCSFEDLRVCVVIKRPNEVVQVGDEEVASVATRRDERGSGTKPS